MSFVCPSVHASIEDVVSVISMVIIVDTFAPKLFSGVRFGSEKNWLCFGIRRSKVKMIGRRDTELSAVCGVLTV